jgi:hypothetical protein
MLHTGARAANRVRKFARIFLFATGQPVPELAVTPASLSAQPLWPVPAVPAATTAALRHRYSRAHRPRSCSSRRLQPPRRARRARASAWLKGAKWRAAGETWAPQAKLWRKCTVAGLYIQRSGRHICPFVNTPFATRCPKKAKSWRNAHKTGPSGATRQQGLTGGVGGRGLVDNTRVQPLVCAVSPANTLATPIPLRLTRRHHAGFGSSRTKPAAHAVAGRGVLLAFCQ